MAKVNLYSSKGVRASAGLTLPKTFSEKENMALLAQAIRVYEAKSHTGLSKVKTRGEIKASTRKIYRQKGTGQARHGALSAPIFVGGGIAHGPKGVKRQLTLSKKMRRKALNLAFSKKREEGKVVGASALNLLKKTKEAQNFLNKVVEKELKGKFPNSILVVLGEGNVEAKRYFQNIPQVKVERMDRLNAFKVFFSNLLIFDKNAFDKKKEKKTEKEEVKKKAVKK